MPVLDASGKELSGAAKRKRYGYPRGNKGRSGPVKAWCFIDTEGATDEAGEYGVRGRQWTMCITAADGEGFERSLSTHRPLRTEELLAFICDLPRGFKLGAYGFGYDVDQITYELGADRLARLHAQEMVLWRSWALRRQATQIKVGRLSSRAAFRDGEGLADWRTVWDVARFYRGRLDRVLSEWGIEASAAELELLEAMKSERGDFTLERWRSSREEIVAYSLLENRLAARLQTRFDELAAEGGFPLTAWYGAGSMAGAMMRARGVRAHLKARAPLSGKRFAAALPYSYFGGRFEILGPGRYEPVFEYDLSSAYPAACLELPCLEHSGRWKYRRRPSTVGDHDLARVSWKLDRRCRWGPFPLRRRDGTVYYPLEGSSWVWGVELRAAIRCFGERFELSESFEHDSRCDCEPFSWLRDIYRRRLELGRDAAGYPLKLGMNSIYGKLASTLGVEIAGGVPSGVCEPRWASMITAWTRARLLDALAAAGGPRTDRVIMFATDAVYSTSPIGSLELGDGLGQWSSASFQSGLLVQPGIYFLHGAGASLKRRGRGLALADVERARARFYRCWDRDGPHGSVLIVTEPRYQSVRLALHRGRELDQAAWRWERERRTISFWPAGKRERFSGGWRPATNEERFQSPFDPRPVHYPHSPFAELLAVGLDGAPPAVAADQVDEQILADDQPRVS